MVNLIAYIIDIAEIKQHSILKESKQNIIKCVTGTIFTRIFLLSHMFVHKACQLMKLVATLDFHQYGLCDQQSLRSACTYSQSYQSLCKLLDLLILTVQYLVFLSLKGGCTGSSESTLVKMPHCWKFHVAAQMLMHLL